MWALEEIGVPYHLIDLDLFQGAQRTDSFRALNPLGKVPVLIEPQVDPEAPFVLSESVAILYYLASRHVEAGLMPDTLIERARCHQWIAFCMTELEPPVWTESKHSFVYRKDRRVEEIKSTCTFEFKRASAHVARALEGREYLVGSTFTIADLLVGQVLMWAKKRGFEVNDERLEEYTRHLKSRPAFRRAISHKNREGAPLES